MAYIEPYDLTAITNGTSGNILTDFVRETSLQTHYVPGLVILIIMFFIVLLSLKIRGFPFPACFVAASFANTLLTVMLFALQIVSGYILLVGIILLPISVLILFLIE